MPLLHYFQTYIWAHLPKTANRKHVLWAAILYPAALLFIAWRLQNKAVLRGQFHSIGSIILVVLAVAIGIALITPRLGDQVYLSILKVAAIFGWIIGRLGLTIVFYLVVTPMALVMRLSGKDPLDQKFKSGKPPQWHPHSGKSEPRRYYRLF